MEIYERPGWGHPSPLINPGEPVSEPIEEVTEDVPTEDAPVEDVPVEETPITPTE